MKCEICGFDRYIENCHIVPKALHGGNEKDNRLILCPNHHKLLDWGRLTNIEMLSIENKIIKLTKKAKIKNDPDKLGYLYWLLGLQETPLFIKERFLKLKKNAKNSNFASYF